MTKVIEIVVIGGTGTGKSHVLELIDKALRAEYGHHVQIASHDLSCERGLGSPGEKPRVSDTIFNLREQGVDTGKTVGSLKIEIDTSDVDSALGKVEALQGFTTGYAIDPIESAITNAAQAANEVEGLTAVILQEHLKQLCEMQRRRLSVVDDCGGLGAKDKALADLTSLAFGLAPHCRGR